MWFPQLHVNRFDRDIRRAEEFGCQGMLGIHWRHRIVDPTAAYMARRFWVPALGSDEYYRAYAATQAAGPRAGALAARLADVDANRKLLATWSGEIRPDGHALTQGFSGDYDEAFTIESGFAISDTLIAGQQLVITELHDLLDQAASPLEAERIGYLYGQIAFLDPYARAWRTGVALYRLLDEQRARRQDGDGAGAVSVIRSEGVRLWIELLELTREAVLSFQHTVATRNDLGMLASIHNKFVRIAIFRFAASLLEFLDELPEEAEVARAAALAPDVELPAALFVPTRPTRLAPGETVAITAIAPGTLQVTGVTFSWQHLGGQGVRHMPMQLAGRRTFTVGFTMPVEVAAGIEYWVTATFAAEPAPVTLTAPPAGPAGVQIGYRITP
jgi:hypothetical protein